MRALAVASLLALALLASPAAAASLGTTAEPAKPGGACDGLVDTLCSDPWGTPNGAICLLAVGGHCLAWL